MKFVHTSSLLLASIALAASVQPMFAQQSRPAAFVIPRVMIPDGSNQSRAPFPSQRPQNDVKGPDGQALDQDLPPNTPATELPAPPPPTVAVLQQGQPGITTTGPVLAMTGRPTVGLTAGLSPTAVTTTIRSQTFQGRDDMLKDIETRVAAAEIPLQEFRRSEAEMAAGARDQFRSAADELVAKERALSNSLYNARRANQTDWAAVQAQLAADYEAYAASAAKLDAAAGIQPAR